MMKFRYVIFTPITDYFKYMFSDLLKLENVEFADDSFKNSHFPRMFRFLYHIHNSKLNRYFKLPGKSIWNKKIYSKPIENPRSVCFVFFMSDLRKNKEPFFKYLRKSYPGSKMVMYFEDIVASRGPQGKSYLDFTLLDKYFDLSISYDEQDCEKYGFKFYPTPYSVQEIHVDETIKESKVFFCGMAKNRIDDIKSSYNYFMSHNLYSDFIVVTNQLEPVSDCGINYRDSFIPYDVYLQHVNKTQCILELLQDGATGYTLRVWEALVYGKKLLTNNPYILKAPFYDPKQFRYSKQFSEDDICFINEKSEIKPQYIEDISPINFLHYLERNL